MKKKYISPKVATFCFDTENIIAQSMQKGSTINDTSEYVFLGRENESSGSNENLWDSGW